MGAYFAVADARRELSAWDSRLRVSSRGYMLGYNDLKDPSVSGFFRFLARVGDNRMNMQIVKLASGTDNNAPQAEAPARRASCRCCFSFKGRGAGTRS